MSIHYTTKRRWESQRITVSPTIHQGKPALEVTIYEMGEVKSTFIKTFRNVQERDVFESNAISALNSLAVQ
jgi:hypothetical protein